MRKHRPRGVTLLASVVLISGALNILRVIQVFRTRDFLNELQNVSVGYMAASGLFWGGFGGILFWLLWNGKRNSKTWFWVFFFIYSAFMWLDRFGIAHGAYRGNWQFMLMINLLFGLLSYWILSRKNEKLFFGDENG